MSDFDKKYPPDVYGEELSDAARVWSVYRDVSGEHDQRRMDGWNRTLDILLIFVRYFAATPYRTDSQAVLTAGRSLLGSGDNIYRRELPAAADRLE